MSQYQLNTLQGQIDDLTSRKRKLQADLEVATTSQFNGVNFNGLLWRGKGKNKAANWESEERNRKSTYCQKINQAIAECEAGIRSANAEIGRVKEVMKKETGVDLDIPAYLTKEEAVDYILGIKNHIVDFKLYGWDKAGIAGYVAFVNETLSKATNKVELMNGLASINRDSVAIGSEVYMAMLQNSKMKAKEKVEMIYNQSTQFGLVLSASLTASSPFFKKFNELVNKSGILQDEVEKKEKNSKYKFSDEWIWLHVDFRNTLNAQILKKHEGLTGEILLKALEEDGFEILLGASYMKKLNEELERLRKNNKGASTEELIKKIDNNALMAELIKINRFHNNSPDKIGVIKIVSDNQYGELEYNMFTGAGNPGSYNYGYDFKTPTDVNYGHKKTDMDPSNLYKSNVTIEPVIKMVTEDKDRDKFSSEFIEKMTKDERKEYEKHAKNMRDNHSQMISN